MQLSQEVAGEMTLSVLLVELPLLIRSFIVHTVC